MTDAVLEHAGWIAVAGAVAMVAATVLGARYAWRQWRRVRVVRHAATELLEVHAERLDAAIVIAGRHTGVLADRGDGFADLLAQLRADVEHLRWLLARIPDERDRLRAAVGEILLPTDDARPRRAQEGMPDGS